MIRLRMWTPNEEDLKSLLSLLSNSQSADNRVQNEVFKTLKQFENRPDFYLYLLFIIRQLRNQLDLNIIITALTIFKNNIYQTYKFLDETAQIEIKNLTIDLISSENDKFRNFAGNILAVIAGGCFAHFAEILPKIAQSINSGESGITISYFSTLEKICEDLFQNSSNYDNDNDSLHNLQINNLPPNLNPAENSNFNNNNNFINPILNNGLNNGGMNNNGLINTGINSGLINPQNLSLAQNQLPAHVLAAAHYLNQNSPLAILSTFLISFLSYNKNDFRNNWSLKCLNILLPIMSDIILSPDYKVVEVASTMILYDDCSTSSAINFLQTLCDISFTSLLGTFNKISTPLLNFLIDDSYNRAFSVAEFWSAFFEQQTSKDLARPFLGILVKNLVKVMIYTDNDPIYEQFKNNDFDDDGDIDPSRLSNSDLDNGDDDEEESVDTDSWTLRKSTALTLDRLAQIYQMEIFPYIPSILESINNADWMRQEAGILALGAISNGCESFAHEFFPALFPLLIKYFTHPHVLMRNIACWTLCRYAEFYNDAEPAYFQQAVLNTLLLLKDKAVIVRSGAFFSLNCYIDSCPDVICAYAPNVAEMIYFTLQTYKGKILRELYEFIGKAAKNLPTLSTHQVFIEKIIPMILDRLIVKTDEFQIIDILLMDLLNNLTYAPGMVLLPYAFHILNYCSSTVKQTLTQILASTETPDVGFPDLDYMIASLDVISSFLLNHEANMLQHIKSLDLVNLLIFCCQVNDFAVQDGAFSGLDHICQYFPDLIMPEISRILPLISSCDIQKCFSALYLCDKIIFHLKNETFRYFDIIFSGVFKLIDINGHIVSKKFKNALIGILNQLSTFCPQQINPHSNLIVFFLIHHISLSRDPHLIYNGFSCLFNLLTDNPGIFKNNVIRIYDLFTSYNGIDPHLRTIFLKMITSNQSKISPQEWSEIHHGVSPMIQNKLKSLCGL